ncbi:hypothetical protein TNCV_201221 [Trichonephila clavipes]|nr:hypothetical protein TNCV_201221 [Trichonephila clavipes]
MCLSSLIIPLQKKPPSNFTSKTVLSERQQPALREYHHLKDLPKGPISRIDLKKMIMKFQETGDLGVLPGRGRKPVRTESVQEVATAVVERASSSPSILRQMVDKCHAN